MSGHSFDGYEPPLPAAGKFPKRFPTLWWRLARNQLDRKRPCRAEQQALMQIGRSRARVFVRRTR